MRNKMEMVLSKQHQAQVVDSYYSINRFRTSLVHFLVGKAATSFLGFVIFLLAVRLLSIRDYGAYVAILAVTELVQALSLIGLDWVGLRWLPEYRVCALKTVFARFVIRLLLFRLATLILACGILLVFSGLLLPLLRITSWRSTFLIYIAIILVEGGSGFIRDVVFVALLQQGRAQIALLGRNLIFVVLLITIWLTNTHVNLEQFAQIELKAVIVGFVLGALLLISGMHFVNQSCEPSWNPPRFSALRETALDNWISQLLSYAYSSQVLVMLLIRMAGPSAAAPYGFARNLIEQVRKYLPSELFIGLIRPMVVASFTRHKNFELLNKQANLIFNISLFTFVPVLLVAMLYGKQILFNLTAGKYSEAHWIVIGLLIWLVPFIGRKILELVVNVVHQTLLWRKATLYSVLLLPVALLGLNFGLGVWSLIGVAIGAEIASIFFIILGLRFQGLIYHIDFKCMVKLMLGVGLSAGIMLVFRFHPKDWAGIALLGILTTTIWLLIAWFIKPFTRSQRAAINRLFKMRVFVW